MVTIENTKELLKELGMPEGQLNDRSALTLLALLNLTPNSNWIDSEQMLLGVTPIMKYSESIWDKKYAPNSRETFRKATLNQL